MRNHTIQPPRRAGFTMVELLVSAAVAILLMVIITGAFTQGLEMFRKLKAAGDMQDKLRQASTTLRDDLAWNHFQSAESNGFPDERAFVRGQDLTKADGEWSPPRAGFFRIIQQAENPQDPVLATRANAFVYDGSDSFGYAFNRATKHSLHFTVQRPASGPDHMFRALDAQRNPPFVSPATDQGVPLVFPNRFIDPTDYREFAGNAFVTRWAEVAYFLTANGESANGVPLFNLYRAQKLLMPPPRDPADSRTPNNPNGGPNNAVVTVGLNYGQVPANPPEYNYNPEMSRRYIMSPQDPNAPSVRPIVPFNRQYPPPLPGAPLQDSEAYNRVTEVTQPRFRYGMLPAADRTNPNPTAQAVNYHNLAGLFQFVDILTPTNWAPGQHYGGNYFNLEANPPFGVGPTDAPTQRSNNDLLLTNVISFEIKALWSFHPQNGPFPQQTYLVPDQTQPGPNKYTQIPNPDYPYDYIPLSNTNGALANRGLRVFDTWSDTGPYGAADNGAQGQGRPYWLQTYNQPNPEHTAARLPLRIRVRSIKIILRIWDPKSEQTRQVTIKQDV